MCPNAYIDGFFQLRSLSNIDHQYDKDISLIVNTALYYYIIIIIYFNYHFKEI